MRALGKGSIGEIIRVGLLITWVILWIALGLVVGAGLLYAARATGVLDPNFATDLFAPSAANPAGLTWSVVAPAFLIGVVALGGGLIIVSHLRKLYQRFSESDPFNAENLTHLRVIWITMLAVELFRVSMTAIMGVLIRGELSVRFELFTWAAIVILIAVAEIFREGARLKEEQELTI